MRAIGVGDFEEEELSGELGLAGGDLDLALAEGEGDLIAELLSEELDVLI